MRKSYHTIEKMGKANARRLAEFLSKNGQFLLPMLDLIEQCRLACDELIDIAGRATVRRCWSSRRNRWREGPPHPGQRRGGEVVWHGQQPGSVMLSESQAGGGTAAAAEARSWGA